jgi:predicted nucleic acid-binding protein
MATKVTERPQGLLDTSVFIAKETDRPLDNLPDAAAVSVITVAKLHLGVLMAHRADARAQRLRTLVAVQNSFDPLPVDAEVARTFAEIVAEARW